jgi:hypothetical protein
MHEWHQASPVAIGGESLSIAMNEIESPLHGFRTPSGNGEWRQWHLIKKKRLHFRHSRVGGNPSFPDNQDMDPRLRGGDEP